jgi:hypothetical protein
VAETTRRPYCPGASPCWASCRVRRWWHGAATALLCHVPQRGHKPAYTAAKEMVYSFMKKEEAQRVMWSMGDVIAAKTKRKWAPIFREQGRVEGRAAALLKLLAARGLHVDDASRQRIESCQDVATLDRWLDRVLVATRIEDVLDDPA